MFKRLSSVMLLAVLFVGAQAFFSCDMADKSDDYTRPALAGDWKSSGGDGFRIIDTTFEYYYNDSVVYAGTIVNNPDLSSDSNYLTLQISTSVGEYSPTLNYYYVVHLKNYNGWAVKMSGAYNSESLNNKGFEERAAAETEFTVANGYFAMYGDYLKQ